MGFILRSVYSDRTELNKSLGGDYQFIHRELNYNEFSNMFNAVFERTYVADNDDESDINTKQIYAFVVHDGGKAIPLNKDLTYFIMTEGGKTFANLSYR